jgi:hypothetical protein
MRAQVDKHDTIRGRRGSSKGSRIRKQRRAATASSGTLLAPMLALKRLGCATANSSLQLPGTISANDYKVIGNAIAQLYQRVNWYLGDWWISGDHRYGERRDIVLSDDWLGPGYQACMDAGLVCRAFAESSRRREVLSFSHHREVAALSAADADALLDWCEQMLAETGTAPSTRALRIERDRRERAAAERIAEPQPGEGTLAMVAAPLPTSRSADLKREQDVPVDMRIPTSSGDPRRQAQVMLMPVSSQSEAGQVREMTVETWPAPSRRDADAIKQMSDAYGDALTRDLTPTAAFDRIVTGLDGMDTTDLSARLQTIIRAIRRALLGFSPKAPVANG